MIFSYLLTLQLKSKLLMPQTIQLSKEFSLKIKIPVYCIEILSSIYIYELLGIHYMD